MYSSDQNLWDAVLQDLSDMQDLGRIAHVAFRLMFAALVGGLLGYQREVADKSAGLRTYMLVTLGSAFFVIVPQLEGISDMSRVIQGIITGLGFLGGGAILKLTEDRQIQGLTTAAGIWMAAAAGVAVGFGRLGTALVGAVLGFLILGALYQLEKRLKAG